MNKNIAILVIFSFVNLFAMDRDINQDHNSSSVELSEFNEEIRTEEINDRAELHRILSEHILDNVARESTTPNNSPTPLDEVLTPSHSPVICSNNSSPSRLQ